MTSPFRSDTSTRHRGVQAFHRRWLGGIVLALYENERRQLMELREHPLDSITDRDVLDRELVALRTEEYSVLGVLLGPDWQRHLTCDLRFTGASEGSTQRVTIKKEEAIQPEWIMNPIVAHSALLELDEGFNGAGPTGGAEQPTGEEELQGGEFRDDDLSNSLVKLMAQHGDRADACSSEAGLQEALLGTIRAAIGNCGGSNETVTLECVAAELVGLFCTGIEPPVN